MSILGNRVLRTEDERMLTVGAQYVADLNVADLKLEGRAHACFVRSTVASGRLVSVDTHKARARPGVLGVFTATDLDLPDLPAVPVADQRMVRPMLARDMVRFVGEPVAAVLADTVAAAVDAAEHVYVDIERLPAVATLADAAAAGALVHADAGTNLTFELVPALRAEVGESLSGGGVGLGLELASASRAEVGESLPVDGVGLDFAGCAVVVEASLRSQRLAAVPLEPRSAAAEWDADGTRLTFHASTQAPHRVRDTLAMVCGLDPADVRVLTPDVGGGFGAKGAPSPEELVVAAVSRAVGRPVVWTESRAENLVSHVHGRAQNLRMRLGGDRRGGITHYELDVTQDAGAYPMIGAFLPTLTATVFTGCYDIANSSVGGRSYTTNTAPVAAYRGAGKPEAIFAIERAVDLFAAQIGMDPAEVRRRNFLTPEQFPYTTAAGSTYDSGDFPEALARTLDTAGYAGLRAEQAQRRADEDPVLLGIGIASYVEGTSMGPSELGEVELAADGSLIVRTGATPFGQGHATCWAMVASEATGVPLDRVAVIAGDTAEISHSGLTAASRSAQLAGSSVHVAATRLVQAARSRAATLLEAADEDIRLDPVSGTFAVAGSPRPRVGWADIAAHAAKAGDGPLAASSEFEQGTNTYAFGCHVAAVEVDSHTGKVTLRSLAACDDAGTVINPLIVEGQVHGGIAQGVAQVLLEDLIYDADANPLTTNLADYPAIAATDLPSFDLVPMETPTPLNPLGAKGIGESGTVGAGAAVLNAVHDALAPYGVDHIDMPATPRRIWQALRQRP